MRLLTIVNVLNLKFFYKIEIYIEIKCNENRNLKEIKFELK